jgi:hypothetical protein
VGIFYNIDIATIKNTDECVAPVETVTMDLKRLGHAHIVLGEGKHFIHKL